MSYPEHEKMKRVRDQYLAVEDFLDFLDGKNIFLAEMCEKENADEVGYFNEDIIP